MNMRDCELVREQIAPYIEGLLSNQEAQQVQAHLAVCTECRRLYSALRQVPEVLKDWQPDPPSEQMWSQITMELGPQFTRKQAQRIRQRKRWLWGGALGAAAVVLLLFVAIRTVYFPASLDYNLGLNAELYAAADKVVHSEAVTFCQIPTTSQVEQLTEAEKKDIAYFEPPDHYVAHYIGKIPCPCGNPHKALAALYGEERSFTMFLLPEECPESHKVLVDSKCHIKKTRDHLILAYRHPCGRTVVIIGKISARDAVRMAMGVNRNP
jgi:hypothetical protein